MKPEEYNISKEKFVFAKNDGRLHDHKLETKPIGFLKDAWNRFKKNRASILAAIIILILVLYAIFVPIFSQYDVSYQDTSFKFAKPKNPISEALNLDFWDGCTVKEVNKEDFYLAYSVGLEIGKNLIKNQEYKTIKKIEFKREKTLYRFRLDTYLKDAIVFKSLTLEEYNRIQKYQDEHDVQIIYPITDPDLRPTSTIDQNNAKYWFLTEEINGKTNTVFENGEFLKYIPIYKGYTGTDNYTSKMRVEGETPAYDYSIINQTGVQVRVDYIEYYLYEHAMKGDGIGKPCFIFGATAYGQDIFTCLASGARFSFILAIVVSIVNLLVGAIYGAIEGYYGGRIDLFMERFSDILSAVPFMIVISLLKYNMASSSQVLILFIAFFLTGWIGMASRTRMQFYRFKNQEYVLAARTLGAKDKRIMFKHIFPNAIGTLITSCVLIIPGMIFSETSLSYLGIINLNSGNMTSVGTLLANAQAYLATYPHMIFFPSIYISLLMLSFNLFGNGLRDAFNPSLRGMED